MDEKTEQNDCPTCKGSGYIEEKGKCQNCGRIFQFLDEYDTLGADKDICCPDCGCEDFEDTSQELEAKLKELNQQ